MNPSELDTLTHISRVRELLQDFSEMLYDRGDQHDLSKLQSPELEGFDRVSSALKKLTYGSPEYAASLAELQPILKHHYEHNSHHPEHHANGIDGMSLLDIVEMFCDWKAAGERHTNGSILRSIEINEKRFKMSPQLVNIFNNTAKKLNWA
jgi:hypothetical protein